MLNLRVRSKLLLFLALTITALTSTTLLIVQHRLRERARQDIHEALRNSVVTFQNYQRQREVDTARSGRLLADLPILKALMTTRHEATIQDASTDLWRQAGTDLFVLADRSGKLMALQVSSPGFDRQIAQESLTQTLERDENRAWWFGGGHLYEVFLQTIYFGAPSDNVPLGVLAVGYEIDDRVAEQASRIASSQVAFRYGPTLVVSTLAPGEQAQLAALGEPLWEGTGVSPADLRLGGERYLGTSVALTPGSNPTASLAVLKSYDKATVFLQDLNRMLLGLGLAAVLAGSALVFVISHTITRPLANLVRGVQALGKRDFAYPLEAHSHDEIAELTTAFDGMRKDLKKSQEDLLHSERLATIGRMASMISHDLRHPLTAILAYAEFLAESNLEEPERKDLHGEIRHAVSRMTDLIGSLLDFSKAQDALRLNYGNVGATVEQAIQTVRVRPEFRSIKFSHACDRSVDFWYDSNKLERVIQNLLLNACEAVPAASGKIDVRTTRTALGIEILVADNGPGIPESVRDTIFQPFVSYGKDGGTGLGLAVAQKVMQDHGGEIRIENTGEHGTIFKLTLPLQGTPTPTRHRT